IAVHRERPGGSPRNAWPTSVGFVEPLGDVVRVRTGTPVPLTAEVTAEAAAALGLEEGAGIWVSIKATEIGLGPEG
ncbi:MAG: TOBE domain-containing protein, partial [Acidimicrobiia bacterium]